MKKRQYGIVFNYNKNIKAIEYLRKNPDKIEWSILSKNPSAIELLKENKDKINWNEISKNPAIFELDYNEMQKNNREIEMELINEIMKPSRLFKMIDRYGYNYIDIYR